MALQGRGLSKQPRVHTVLPTTIAFGETMKKLLGALVAALVLGAGCAHNQEKTAQTEVPSAPQASVESGGQGQVGGSGMLSGMDCEVISTGGSGAVGSGMIQNEPSASVTQDLGTQQPESVPSEDSSGMSQDNAIGGSASADVASSGAVSSDVALDDSASGDVAIGGLETQDDAIGGSGSEEAVPGGSLASNLALIGSASQNAQASGSASDEAAAGGSGTQDIAIGGSASQDVAPSGAASENLDTGNQASEDAAFERTDLGGTGGGGG
jgi:hypothetical protein